MKILSHGLVFLMLAAVLTVGAAKVPGSFNYQGVLRDGLGGALPAAPTLVHFKLYDVPAAGSALWTQEATVLLDLNGLFNVTLTDENGLLTGVIASHATLFLGLTVEGGSEISPRQQLLSVPFALKAGDVSQASGDFTVTGSLAVDDGAHIQGLVQASGVQIGGNTLTTNSTGNGNLTLGGNVDVTHELHVEQNLTVDGATTLNGDATVSNLKVTGSTMLFSRQYTSSDTWSSNWTGTKTHPATNLPSPQTVLADAPGDGFVVFNLNYYLMLGNSGDVHHFEYTVTIGKGPSDPNQRTFNQGFYISDQDTYSIIRNDVSTFPVLGGESVKLTFTAFQIIPKDEATDKSGSSITLKCVYTPFGTSTSCGTNK